MFGNEFTIEGMVHSPLEIFMNGIDSNLPKFLMTDIFFFLTLVFKIQLTRANSLLVFS